MPAGRPLRCSLLTPADKLDKRRAEYPDLKVVPLKFASSELQAGHWRFLMGGVGNQATYIRKLNQVMRDLRADLTLPKLRTAVSNAGLPDSLRELANLRLDLGGDLHRRLVSAQRADSAGETCDLHLRDEFIEKDEALGLFVVLLQIFSDATWRGRSSTS